MRLAGIEPGDIIRVDDGLRSEVVERAGTRLRRVHHWTAWSANRQGARSRGALAQGPRTHSRSHPSVKSVRDGRCTPLHGRERRVTLADALVRGRAQRGQFAASS